MTPYISTFYAICKNNKIIIMRGNSFVSFLPIVLKIISRYQKMSILYININMKFLHITIPTS